MWTQWISFDGFWMDWLRGSLWNVLVIFHGWKFMKTRVFLYVTINTGVSFEVANGLGPYRSFEYKSFEYRFQGPIVPWKNSGSFGNEICYCQLPNISDHRRLSGVTGICKGPFFGHLNGDNSGKNRCVRFQSALKNDRSIMDLPHPASREMCSSPWNP